MTEKAEEVKNEETEVKATKSSEVTDSSLTAPVNPLARSVEVTVSQDAVSAGTESRLKGYAKKARVDGFRRGHVPMNIVRSLYGQEAYSEALNEEIGKAVEKAITEGGFRIAGTPEVVPAKDMPTDGKSDLKFEAHFEVIPEVETPDFANLELHRFVCDVTDKEVTDTLNVMLKQRATYKDVERASQKDDEVTVDFEGKIDGVAFDGGTAKDYAFIVGAGQMLPEFDAAATGLKAGETKEFKLTFPVDYGAKNLAGKIVVFALGTNGLVTDDQIDAIMADAGDKRMVVFVNTRSPQPWVGSTNQAIANAATRYKNVRVIDWYGYSANRNDLFDGDGTHLSTTGVTEYLNLIHDAVKKDLPVHPEDHVNDPQPAAVKSATDALVNALALKPHKLGTDK